MEGMMAQIIGIGLAGAGVIGGLLKWFETQAQQFAHARGELTGE